MGMKMFVGLGVSALVLAPVACHKEEQAVVGVAQTAVNAEHKAQATASERDQQRVQLEQIPLPTKSQYVDVRDQAVWANPFLLVGPETMSLRVDLAEAVPVAAGPNVGARPQMARRQETQVKPEDLARAVAQIPASAWRYGRVIAVAEAPQAVAKDRTKGRRNVEAAIQKLNDLGVVVEEWPTH